MQGEGDNVGRRCGNRASRHVTVFCTTPDLRPRLGTLVPQDCVSTASGGRTSTSQPRIEFEEDGEDLVDDPGDDDNDNDDKGRGGGWMRKFVLSGWGYARILGNGNGKGNVARNTRRRYDSVPKFWTPTIKALWAPILLPLGGKRSGGEDKTMSGGREEGLLLLHKLTSQKPLLDLKNYNFFRGP